MKRIARWTSALLIVSACDKGGGDSSDADTADIADTAADTADIADTVDVTVNDTTADVPGDTAADIDTAADSDTNDAETEDVTDTNGDIDASLPEGCCLSAMDDCGVGAVCVHGENRVIDAGRCMPLTAEGCWDDSQCGAGETCEGENICPCGAACLVADSPGTCKGPASCCDADNDCAEGEACTSSPGFDGTCQEGPESGCWNDLDCPGEGAQCLGERVCPCGALCILPDAPGTCAGKGCCLADSDCGGGHCASFGTVPGTCKMDELAAGQCWADDDCGAGGVCQDARICPCGASCIVADAPGQCRSSACVTLDPMGYGMCDMVLGVAFNGTACVTVSGCSCGEDCDHFFESPEACEAACGEVQ
jgi:hypothetical protein